ncbi:MAG: hypothetical protein NTW80_05040 [Deltaproteobacteria bacterium]|nr:hypothetical protein [Deltaproteobacteria bacterium]
MNVPSRGQHGQGNISECSTADDLVNRRMAAYPQEVTPSLGVAAYR